MQSTLENDDKQAGLNDLVAILDHDPSRVMLEPPDLHVDPVERAMSLAAQLPPPDPALRAAPPVNDNAAPPSLPRTRSFARGVVRAVLAIAVGAAATVGWLSYGEAARQMVAAWTPQLVAAMPAPDVKVAEQEAAPVAQQPPAPPVAAAAVAPPPAPEAPAAPVQAATVQAAAPDLAPKLDEMVREIASLRETIEQLKSGQQQLGRDLAKAIEQEARRKAATATPPSAPKPTATAVRNPPPLPQPAYTPPPPQRQVYVPPPREYSPREVYAEPPRVYTPPPPQVYVPPPPSVYEAGAPRPPRPLP